MNAIIRTLLILVLFVNSTALRNLRLLKRLDRSAQIVHFEYYRQFWPLWLLSAVTKLPKKLRFIRPIAKAGIRSYTANVTSTDSMSAIIESLDGDGSSAVDQKEDLVQDGVTKYLLGLLIYMYVNPSHRGQGIGDHLLDKCLDACRQRGDSHMLLVHDDSGSGRLVDFYSQRGFVDVSDFIARGMIRAL